MPPLNLTSSSFRPDGPLGRAGFVIAVATLVFVQVACEPLFRTNLEIASLLTIPYFAVLFVLLSRRGVDMGISPLAAISLFVVGMWTAETAVQLFPSMLTARVLPLLAFMIWPGQAAATRYGSSRTVQ